ncbi:hypothetical protein OCU04_006123 [Sclerotinia nivalis]|uniref:Uncharacterized protein n=1 Tax=Sclerotinia nivalis TaxID=352851 RepID=A0A9X0AN76_9HELO|nr:hypothetical protein OCU04_006123 [Sclerotinia nivalis]
MLVRRVIRGNPDKYFKMFLPTEPMGELINIGIRLQPLDEMRMARLLAVMRGPEISPMYDAHESIPNVTLLKGLGTSNISLIRNAMMEIANAQPRFSIAIDRIDIEGGYGSKRNCEYHWATDSPEVMAIHGKLIQVLGNLPWLFKLRSRFTVSDITPLTKLMIKKSAEMPRHIADHYR